MTSTVPLHLLLGAAWLALALCCQAVGALIVGPSTVRKVAALACTLVTAVPAAFLPPEFPFQRAVLWLYLALMFMRMVDVVSEAEKPVGERLALALLAFDPRDMTDVKPSVDLRAGARVIGWGAVFATSLWFEYMRLDTLPVVHREVALLWACWLLGALAVYALMEVVGATGQALFALVGLRVQPFQRDPILSRSLVEFWGKRWNREVGRWLHRWCFLPFARRGWPKLGVAWSFVFSGLFHAISLYAALGWRGALPMGAFFLVQGGLVATERLIGVARWPALSARVWTIGTFILTMPLFVDPALATLALSPLGAAVWGDVSARPQGFGPN